MTKTWKSIPIGTSVFVSLQELDQEDQKKYKPFSKNGILQLKVSRQEWWSSNQDHPVYYDLIDHDGKKLGLNGSGNWHYMNVFLSPGDV